LEQAKTMQKGHLNSTAKKSKKLIEKPLIKGHEEIVIAGSNPALNNQQYCTHN
jgi:hypothetical protein